jgi:hypothetical protein
LIMEPESSNTSKYRPMVRTILNLVVADLILIAISWAIGWPSINGTALFLLGLLILFGGYGIETLFYGGRYVNMNRGVYSPKTEYDRLSIEIGGRPGTDLEKIKAPPVILRDITVAGLVAIILSFILPRFF